MDESDKFDSLFAKNEFANSFDYFLTENGP